jgi:hypothetical protein
MKNDKKIDLIGSGLKPSFVFSLNENQINVLHKRLTESKKEQKEAEIILDPKNPKDMEMAKQKGLATPDGKIKTQMEGEMTEKAVSKQQQKFFGVVSAMQKGDIPKKGKAGKAAKEMTKKVEDKKIEESLSRIIEDQLFPTMTKNDLMETISRLMNEDPTIAPPKPKPEVLPTPTKPDYDPFNDPDPGVNPEAKNPDVLPKPKPEVVPTPTKPDYDPFNDPDPGVNPEAKKPGFNAFMNQVQKYNMLKNNF